MIVARPDSNLDVVKRLYESFANGDIEGVRATWDEDIELHEPKGYAGGGGTHHGAEEILEEVFGRFGTEWVDVEVETDRLVDDGDTVVMLGRWSGTYAETGKSVSFPLAHVFDLEEGKIVRWQSFGDTAQFNAALEA